MSYEKIVIELFSRVKELEDKVNTLEGLVNQQEPADNSTAHRETERVTRNSSRINVMEKMKKRNPRFIIEKGSRASGADIILITHEETPLVLKAKFYHSKSHHGYVSGWHTVNEDDLYNQDINFYIFTIEFRSNYHTFFFTRNELLGFVRDKAKDQKNLYHFYFRIVDSQPIECRDGEKNAAKYYDRWGLPSIY